MCSLYTYNANLSFWNVFPIECVFYIYIIECVLYRVCFLYLYYRMCSLFAYNVVFPIECVFYIYIIKMCSLYAYNTNPVSPACLHCSKLIFFSSCVHVGAYNANLSLPYLPPLDCILFYFISLFFLPVCMSVHTMRISVSPTCLHLRVRTIKPPSAFSNFSSVKSNFFSFFFSKKKVSA